jgi:sugar O-acyltransferase (sialic acid O-acetyltransferase NeuD family)
MKKILIIGAGGSGKEIAQLIKDINKVKATWEIVGYLDDNKELHGKIKNGVPVIGSLELIPIYANQYFFICSIGNPRIKQEVLQKCRSMNPSLQFATLIHPTATIGDENSILEGSIICARSVITTNINIGKHVLVNYGTTIGHDTTIGDYCAILPGVNVSGNVTISEGVSIGANSVIIPDVTIGLEATIGAGSVVINNIPGHCTAIGAPAKPIKYNM